MAMANANAESNTLATVEGLYMLATSQGDCLSSVSRTAFTQAYKMWEAMSKAIKSIPYTMQSNSGICYASETINDMGEYFSVSLRGRKKNREALQGLNWSLQNFLAGAVQQVQDAIAYSNSMARNSLVKPSGLAPMYAVNAEILLGKNRCTDPVTYTDDMLKKCDDLFAPFFQETSGKGEEIHAQGELASA